MATSYKTLREEYNIYNIYIHVKCKNKMLLRSNNLVNTLKNKFTIYLKITVS
jgi:hypothetical protein